ncbi:hypothetical protein ACFWIB_01605 [Streptomyces sp. NPDC127051]|uniref:hypothetical protein n=1 Tax=Streptomyces sp. NPDC127051 TaxID=3347119 RepID=UPI00365AABE3
MERDLERGPMVHGWADQWTLARIKTLIGRLFHVSYTVEGTWLLPERLAAARPARDRARRRGGRGLEEGHLAAGNEHRGGA